MVAKLNKEMNGILCHWTGTPTSSRGIWVPSHYTYIKTCLHLYCAVLHLPLQTTRLTLKTISSFTDVK